MTTQTSKANEPAPLGPVARPARRSDAKIKMLGWGDAGSGKTRLGLSFPKPIIADLENGTLWYADEFDFLVASTTMTDTAGNVRELTPEQLVRTLVGQIQKDMYPDRETLVIDAAHKFIDSLQSAIIDDMKRKGTNVENLSGMPRAKAWHELNERLEKMIETILKLPMHVVFLARAKNEWGKGDDGKMEVLGRTFDLKDSVEYLVDVTIHLHRGGTADVIKSRIRQLPSMIRAVSYRDLEAAITAGVGDGELAAPVATAAEIKAAEKNPTLAANLPEAARQPAPPVEEPPALNELDMAGLGGETPKDPSIDEDTIGKLDQQIARLFGDDPDDRQRAIDWISDQVGEPLESLASLRQEEGLSVLAKMRSLPPATFRAAS